MMIRRDCCLFILAILTNLIVLPACMVTNDADWKINKSNVDEIILDEGLGSGDESATQTEDDSATYFTYDLDTDDDTDGFTENGGDCDDTDETVNPDEIEICDDGIDQDCSGTDLGCDDVDDDGDGYAENGGDCDDTDAEVSPVGTEICGDEVDQDCSGSDLDCDDVDDDLDGYTENGGDCDDNDDAINPIAEEICGDGIDQDCNGNDRSCNTVDNDGDWYTENQNDCNDEDATINPASTEICGDGIDQDCDEADLDCNDVDDDGDGYTENEGDCDDTNSDIYPDTDCGRCIDHSDTTPPSVSSHLPTAGETEVDPLAFDFEFQIIFSEKIMTDVINDDNPGDFLVFNVTAGVYVDGEFTYTESAEGSTRVIEFEHDLGYCSDYIVYINLAGGISDENCNAMAAPYSWTFSTVDNGTCSPETVSVGTDGSGSVTVNVPDLGNIPNLGD